MSVLIAVLALSLGDPDTTLPRSLSESFSTEATEPAEPAAAAERTGSWAVAPRVGYVLTPDADHGTWTAGVQFRHYAWDLLAFEASVDIHKDRYEDGDQVTSMIPVELSALIFPFKNLPIRPYGLAGIGVYILDTRYSGSLSSNSDSTRAYFGVHVGFGVEVDLTEKIWIDSDFRWIFMQKPAHFSGDSSDYLMITVGVNFKIG